MRRPLGACQLLARCREAIRGAKPEAEGLVRHSTQLDREPAERCRLAACLRRDVAVLSPRIFTGSRTGAAGRPLDGSYLTTSENQLWINQSEVAEPWITIGNLVSQGFNFLSIASLDRKPLEQRLTQRCLIMCDPSVCG